LESIVTDEQEAHVLLEANVVAGLMQQGQDGRYYPTEQGLETFDLLLAALGPYNAMVRMSTSVNLHERFFAAFATPELVEQLHALDERAQDVTNGMDSQDEVDRDGPADG
jgi:hypothetical protein